MSKDEMKHEKWFLKNQYIVGLPKKRGTWTVCRFKGRGARQERGERCYHQCTLWRLICEEGEIS